MKYDFDRVIDRKNTASSKWDRNELLFGREDVLDLWVADMDFPVPREVVEAIKERADHPIFGYTFPPDSLYEAIIGFAKRHYGWEIKKDWIVFTAGVVNGLYSAINAFSQTGDEVVIQPPVYYPFYKAVSNTGRQLVENPLVLKGDRYHMDFDDLRSHFEVVTTFPGKKPRIKMVILCSPHNPVGRVWTEEELRTLGEICVENDCLLISDEIHCDLMMGDHEHTVTATLSEELAQKTITFMSVSKTFNLAGLKTSVAVIEDPTLRREFVNAREGSCSGNLFGFVAMEAAYRYGDDYLEQLLEYLNDNLRFFVDYVEENMPQLDVIEPEGTYLAWLDMRNLGMDALELQDFIRNEARLALDDGYAFGTGGEGFQRVNLATPRPILEEALNRLEQALNRL